MLDTSDPDAEPRTVGARGRLTLAARSLALLRRAD